MRYKNSFFRLETKDDGTYLDLYPAVSDGKPLEIKEVINFIDRKDCTGYSLDAVKSAFVSLKDKPVQVKLCDYIIDPYDESVDISVTQDSMTAIARFYPPSGNGKYMSKNEILAELQRLKINTGIQERVIDVFLQARQYCLNIPIAKGIRPVPAIDSNIEYFFDTKPLAKPKMQEDGSVDFHELNLFTKVKKGDMLAKLTPHDPGKPGKDVYGRNVQQNRCKVKKLKYSRNITASEDGNTIYSDVDGNVTLTNGMVFVSDTYNVAADVDASTGDIEYEGNVMVAGNVRTGFTIRAKGDVQVNGVVEGATIEAGGNIVIKRGVQGMSKGRLKAGGDICAQFLESANVSCDGDIIVGSVLHSNVAAKGKVTVSGRKGFIVGGEVACGVSVEVNSIGNKMETQTIIKVGVNPELYEEMKGLVTVVTEINSIYQETESYLNVYKEKLKKGIKLSPENVKQIKLYSDKLKGMQEEKQAKNERLLEIKEALNEGKKGNVKVLGNSYRGVSIFIASSIYTVKETEKHCWYKINGGEITPTTF